MRFLKGLLGAFVFVEVVHVASLLLAPPTETPFAAVLWDLLLNVAGSATISAVFTVDSNPAWRPGSYAKYGACAFACAVVLVIVAAVLLGVQPSVWTSRYALQLVVYATFAGTAGGIGYLSLRPENPTPTANARNAFRTERTAPMRILKGMLGAFFGISLAHLFGVLLTGPIEILTVYYFQNMVMNLIAAFLVGLTLSVSESKTWTGTTYATAGGAAFAVIAAAIVVIMTLTVSDVSATLGRMLLIGVYAVIAGAFAGVGFRTLAGARN